MSALESALRLTSVGIASFPVAGDKTPLVSGWTNGAAATEDEVRRLFAAFPHAPCIGASNGQSGVVTVDFDWYKGAKDALGRLLMDYGDEWQDTVTADTPRGRHYHFRDEEKRFKNTVSVIAPGVDTRGVGGYVIVPESESIHGTYRWVDGYSPFDRPMLPAPEWLPPAIRRTRRTTRETTERGLMQVLDIPDLHQSVAQALQRDDGLRDLAQCEPVMLALAHAMGIQARAIGEPFHCVLHPDRHPSAALYRDRKGAIVYHDFHRAGKPGEWLTLPELFYARTTGKVRKLKGPLHATWFRRLLVESGLVAPVHVHLRPLPPDASASLRKVYKGVRLLFSVKWLGEFGAPSPLTWRFLEDWCGVAQGTAAKSLQTLVSRGILKHVGSHSAAYGSDMGLYLPVPP